MTIPPIQMTHRQALVLRLEKVGHKAHRQARLELQDQACLTTNGDITNIGRDALAAYDSEFVVMPRSTVECLVLYGKAHSLSHGEDMDQLDAAIIEAEVALEAK